MMTVTNRPLHDYAELEYLLLGDLSELLQQSLNDSENRRWIVAVVDVLLETLDCTLQLEDDEGYMCEVLDVCPNWSAQVERLLAEQNTLHSRLKQLRYRMSESLPLSQVAELLRTQLRDWMATFAAHRRHERRLLQDAFTLDFGCGD